MLSCASRLGIDPNQQSSISSTYMLATFTTTQYLSAFIYDTKVDP